MDFFGLTRRDLMLAAGEATLPALVGGVARSAEGELDKISSVRAA